MLPVIPEWLANMVVGGLIVSTVFTLLLVPMVFSLAMDAREALRNSLARGQPTSRPA